MMYVQNPTKILNSYVFKYSKYKTYAQQKKAT